MAGLDGIKTKSTLKQMAGGVFPKELLTKFIAIKRAECREMNAIPTPAEFERYYNL